MKTEDKIWEGWQYVCKSCELVYQVYGDRLLCDLCNRHLKLVPPEEVKRLLEKWEAKPVAGAPGKH